MNGLFLLQGAVLGFSVAAPVGQIGILCIRRTLAEGRAHGFVSGLGAATADSLYGTLAAFGLTAVSAFMMSQQVWLRLVGGLFLCYLGVRTFLSKPANDRASDGSRSVLASYSSTLALTLANPSTILSFAAVFAGLGLGQGSRDYASSALIVVGVFAGSALWWLILSSAVGTLRARIGRGALLWVNRGSGVLLAGLGVLALASLVVA